MIRVPVLPPRTVVEPCPAHLKREAQPIYGGRLFFNLEEGRSGCASCGWSGVPTVQRGVISTRCPACESESDDLPPDATKAPRNQPCPCGSGVKAKKCGCAEFCV